MSANLTVTLPSLASISITPASVYGGTSSTGTVILTGAAGSGGVIVKLSINSSSATAPPSVTVEAGKTSANFTVKTGAVAETVVATVTGSLDGVSQTATLTIEPPAIKSLTLNPASLAGGKNSVGTITIGSIAPTKGLVISVSSSKSSAKAPTTVTIPAGKTSATFTIKTSAVSSTNAVEITATSNGITATATLTIT